MWEMNSHLLNQFKSIGVQLLLKDFDIKLNKFKPVLIAPKVWVEAENS